MAKDCVHVVLAPLGLAFAAQHGDDGTISARSNQVETAAAIPILCTVGGPKDSVVAASNGDPLITYPLIDEKKQQDGVAVVEVMAAISWMTSTVDKLGNGNGATAQASPSEKETSDLAESDATADQELNGDESASDDNDGSQGDDDDAATGMNNTPALEKGKPKQLTFVTRIVRELSFKREINVRINKTQLEMKKMQLLISGYQADVQRTLEQLKKEAMELDEGCVGIKQRVASTLTRLTVDGCSRQLVDTYRSFQLLLLQENKLRRAKAALRQAILQTRVEECDWMGKSVGERFQQQVQLLSSQLSAGRSSSGDAIPLDSDQHFVDQTLAPDDPFFATPDHLHESNAQSKQLDLQLRSITALILTMRTKLQELITQTGESDDELQCLLAAPAQTPASAAVPSVKRNSFKAKEPSNSNALSARQSELRRVLSGVSKLIDLRASCSRIQDDHTLYNEQLNAFARVVSDQRTRAGRLLAAFHKKLADDARVDVEITTTTTRLTQTAQAIDGDGDESVPTSEEEAAPDVSDAVEENETNSSNRNNFYFLDPNALTEANQSSEHEGQTISTAIDVNQLPPPVWILAFARFLHKVIASEYALDQQGDLGEKLDREVENDDETHSNSDADGSKRLDLDHHRITSERALEACVHHFVFSKLSTFCVTYEQTKFCREDDLGCDVEADEHPYLQQHHWKHSKQQMQGVSWEQLAFPRGVADKIRAHFDSNSINNETHHPHQDSFLPQALHAFKSVECETTPRGIIRAVMIAFTVLHRELNQLLSSNRDTETSTASSLLSADVLVPSLVLMMSRLNHDSELDLLWRRLNLVRVFESTLLSQGCEEAYYLTCLLGATQVIQTFASDSTGGGCQMSLAATLKSCDHCKKLVAYHHRHVAIKRYCCGDDNRRSCDSQDAAVSTKASISKFPKAKTKSSKKLKDANANANPTSSQTPSSSSSSSSLLRLNEEADAIENLSKWIANQASVESVRAPTDLVVAAHELWLYEQAQADEIDT